MGVLLVLLWVWMFCLVGISLYLVVLCSLFDCFECCLVDDLVGWVCFILVFCFVCVCLIWLGGLLIGIVGWFA